MKKLFSLMTIVALTVPMYGCGDTKKEPAKTTPPADAPKGDTPKTDK